MKTKRINWWIVAAVLIVGIPVGFVLTGLFNRTDKQSATQETETIAVIEEVESTETQSASADTIVTETVETETEPEPAAEPEQAVEKPAPVKKELTPEQLAEQQERQRQKAEERRLPDEQKAEEKRLADAEKARKAAEKAEAERQKAEAEKAEAERKAQAAREKFIAEVRGLVTSGKASSKVPEGCTVVVNNKQTTNYQNFRNGVKLGSYSGVKVTKVEGEGVATRVYVTAKVDAADD